MPSLRCHLCGEIITCPYQFNGNVYGYTCITKVNPGTKKSKNKENWVSADSFTSELLDNGNLRIIAAYTGNYYKSHKFIDFHSTTNIFRKNILIEGDNAFINLSAYGDRGRLHI